MRYHFGLGIGHIYDHDAFYDPIVHGTQTGAELSHDGSDTSENDANSNNGSDEEGSLESSGDENGQSDDEQEEPIDDDELDAMEEMYGQVAFYD